MSLLDSIENQVSGKLFGGSSNSLATSLLAMIQNQPGGLQGLVQSFHDKGLGEIASSWVGTGQNLPISADQIHQVLGSEQVKELATKAGISPDLAGGEIAQLLPEIVDRLTPNGQLPSRGSVMDMIGGLLQNLGKAS